MVFGDHYNPWGKYFSELFFTGGSISFNTEEIKKNPKGVEKAWKYVRAFMRSFEPKHEDKEAVCAYIMSHILVMPEEKE